MVLKLKPSSHNFFVILKMRTLLYNEDTNEKKNFNFYFASFADDSSFCLYDLLEILKVKGNPIDNCMIFWFDYDNDYYIYVSNDPKWIFAYFSIQFA